MPLARALKGDTIHEKVIDFEGFDGREWTELVSAAPVRTSDGKIIGSVAIVQDITEYKKREEHLRSDLNARINEHNVT
jgi:PAS domain S-box-containing protein